MCKRNRIFSVCGAVALLAATLLTAWVPAGAATVTAGTSPYAVKPGILTGANQAWYLETAGPNLLASQVDQATGWKSAANGNGYVLKHVYTYYGSDAVTGVAGYTNARSSSVKYAYLLADGGLYRVNSTATWDVSGVGVDVDNAGKTSTDPADYGMATIIFDLGESASIGRILLGNAPTNVLGGQLWQGKLWIGDAFGEALLNDEYFMGEWSYLDDAATVDPAASSSRRGVVFDFSRRAVQGRYVAVQVPASAEAKYPAMVNFSEVGVYAARDEETQPAYLTGDADVKWLMNDAYTKDNQQLSAGKNLMAGRWTTNTNNAKGVTVLSNVYSFYGWSYNGQPANSWQNPRSSTEIQTAEVLSDGRIYGLGDKMSMDWSCGWLEIGGTNHSNNGATPLADYQMVKIIFDLGESTPIGRILFGDNVANGTTQTPLMSRLWQGQLYVGDDFGNDLFTDAHRQGGWSYLTDEQLQAGSITTSAATDIKGVAFDFDAPVTGRYVGILVPAAGGGSGYQVRLGEVGIYAYENTVHFLSEESDAHWLNSSGRNLVTSMLADHEGTTKADGNWIPNRIHTAGDTTEAHIRTAATRSCLVDGRIAGINADTAEQAVLQLGVQGKAAGVDGWQYPLGQLTFDLGESTVIGRIVVGFPAEDTAGSNPQVGVIYIADTEEDLFTDASVQATWSYLTNNGNNWGNIQAVSDKGVALDLPEGVTGRYVGFKISEAGNVGYGVNLSEIGIYAKETAASCLTNLGASVRNALSHQEGEPYALRFGFTASDTTAAYRAEDPAAAKDYTADWGTVTVDGQAYPITRMGAMVTRRSLRYADALVDPANMDTTTSADVPAVKLTDVDAETGLVTYTAVVVNVPEGKAGHTLYARPYIQYTDGSGNTVTLLGEIIGRSVLDVLNAAEL